MHDAFTIGVPTLVVLFGILLNRYDYKRLEETLRAEVKALRAEFRGEVASLRAEMMALFDKVDERFDKVDERFEKMHERFDRVDDDLRRFYSITGEHEGRISLLEKLRDR